MKAIVITRHGGPGVLELQERPRPVAGPGEVLIKVVAAGVNRPDIAQRKGKYPPPPGAPPDIPGLEISGIVEELGDGCLRWQIGDTVCALVIGGAYAEYCTVPEGQCLPVPASISIRDAASLPETFFTVWSNVFDRAALKQGETILVHGGSGGIGTAAIQLCVAAGARVFATAGSAEKCLYCRNLGAELTINYKLQNFKETIRGHAGQYSVDIVLDMIGGANTNDNLGVLTDEGRLVLINYSGGDESTIELSAILKRRLTITGSMLRPRSVAFKTSVARKLEDVVWPWLRQGIVRPVIDRVYPLEQAPEAHARMEEGLHMGKIILTTGADIS